MAVGAAWLTSGCDRSSPGEDHPGSIVSPAALDTSSGVSGFQGDSCKPCHDPNKPAPNRERDGWLPTCTTAGCHPRAWNETIFHRVDPEVFKDCINCHVPHVWKAVGADCLSCHGTGGTRVAKAAMAAFPHERHASLECATCHESRDRHATLLVTRKEQCQACHHGPPAVASCTTCHSAADRTGQRAVGATMKLSGNTPPRERTLKFDHARHEDLDCGACHGDPIGGGARVDCRECHHDHDRPDAACGACHRDPPEKVHSILVHETGCAAAECHSRNGLESIAPPRELCLACHSYAVDHQPGKACASCHLVTLGHGGGS
ncbi:MAG: hypothetical protein FD129_629 [bacterium]|nr:MAG: hypothetical protein FD129_629 [bacterium]